MIIPVTTVLKFAPDRCLPLFCYFFFSGVLSCSYMWNMFHCLFILSDSMYLFYCISLVSFISGLTEWLHGESVFQDSGAIALVS